MTGRRSLEEEHTLKQSFSALVPAFDPRPGRTNISQTQDFHVPAPGSEEATSQNQIPIMAPPGSVKLSLAVKVWTCH